MQDDRLWIAYGGQYSAAGTHGSCPERYQGRAYVNQQEWDISDLGQCQQGVGCPVSRTYTDQQFEVPMGCASINMQATKNGGRGTITSFPPTRASGYRGELEISDDGFGGADVFDVTVTLTCQNVGIQSGISGGSTAASNVRLSCAHASQMAANDNSVVDESQQVWYNAGAAQPCRMGRVEVYNPTARHADHRGQGTWGTVCASRKHPGFCRSRLSVSVCQVVTTTGT